MAGKIRPEGYVKVHRSYGGIDSRRAETRQIATWWEATRAPAHLALLVNLLLEVGTVNRNLCFC